MVRNLNLLAVGLLLCRKIQKLVKCIRRPIILHNYECWRQVDQKLDMTNNHNVHYSDGVLKVIIVKVGYQI